MELNQVTLPCVDYDASVGFYRTFGLRQIVDNPPQYARFETPAGQTLSIHATAAGTPAHEVVVYFEVQDVDATVAAVEARGLKFESQPVDQSWLWREAYIHDPAGNLLCIFHAGENRRYPPWRIDTDPE